MPNGVGLSRASGCRGLAGTNMTIPGHRCPPGRRPDPSESSRPSSRGRDSDRSSDGCRDRHDHDAAADSAFERHDIASAYRRRPAASRAACLVSDRARRRESAASERSQHLEQRRRRRHPRRRPHHADESAAAAPWCRSRSVTGPDRSTSPPTTRCNLNQATAGGRWNGPGAAQYRAANDRTRRRQRTPCARCRPRAPRHHRATRIRMISYYIDNVTDPERPRLVRRINNGHPWTLRQQRRERRSRSTSRTCRFPTTWSTA